ncbi:MAG: hypothetical protein Fur0040_06840 [Sideroxydans sp.]
MLDYPQVALDFMNRDHAEFVASLDELLALLARSDRIADVEAHLDQLLEHTRTHFAAEETAMRAAAFPPYPVHKGEHDRVLADMQTRITDWRHSRNTDALRDWLQGTLSDWFVSHVGTMDFVTARFIAQMTPDR